MATRKREPANEDDRQTQTEGVYQPHETRRLTNVPRPIRMSTPRLPETHPSTQRIPPHIRKLVTAPPPLTHTETHVDQLETAPLPHLPTAQEIDDLKRSWLVMPTWDIEWSV